MVLLPLILAGLVAVSRTRDYRHNFSDILGGSLIGIFFAIALYFLKFKSLTSHQSDELKIEAKEDEHKREPMLFDEEEQI